MTNVKYKLIVSMTSWKNRINFCYPALYSICTQTIQPDIFYLVLSIKEFPNKLNSLPFFIKILLKKYTFFKILWVNDNIKQFKKNLPILSKYWCQNNVLLFITDDDIYYKPEYLSVTYNNFLKLNPNVPDTILTYNYGWPLTNPIYYDKLTNCCRLIGMFEILYPPFFTNNIVLNITEQDIALNTWISEDWWITYNLYQNKALKWYQHDYDILKNLYNFTCHDINPLYKIYNSLTNDEQLNIVKNLYINKVKL